MIAITKTDGVTEDDILMAVLDAGAEEVIDQGGGFEVVTEPSQLIAARTALQEAGLDYDSAEAEFLANVKIDADAETARKLIKLVDAVDDLDDVQNVYTNVSLSDAVRAELDADDE